MKSFCFHDGVNCKLIDIANEDEFESKFLFQNYFSNAIDYFILTQNSQQQEVYVDEVFYIFGMKYYDFHIIVSDYYLYLIIKFYTRILMTILKRKIH